MTEKNNIWVYSSSSAKVDWNNQYLIIELLKMQTRHRQELSLS